MNENKCLQCGQPTKGRSKRGLCHQCAGKQMWQRPEHRLKVVAAITSAMHRPEINIKLRKPKSEEGRANMKAAQNRPELRVLHSELNRGEKNYFFGKPSPMRGVFGKDHPSFGNRWKKKYSMRGPNNPFYGKRHKFEARVKNAEAHIGKHMGPENNRWKGGIQPDPYDYTFTAFLKNQVRERDSFKCRICQKPEGKCHHHVHHIFYNRRDRDLNKLITLCIKCHWLAHSQKDIWPPILTAKISG